MIDPEGKKTTAPAEDGAPSAGEGNSAHRGEETMLMPRQTCSVWEVDGPGFKSGEWFGVLTIQWALTFTPPSRTTLSGPCSPWSVSGMSILSIPLRRTYIPPPTAPARQATWAISASPPHFDMTEAKPGPNFPTDVRCRWIDVRASNVVVWDGVSGDEVRATMGACKSAGILKWRVKMWAKGQAPHSSRKGVSMAGSAASLRNFITTLAERRSILLSPKTSSRPPGILDKQPVERDEEMVVISYVRGVASFSGLYTHQLPTARNSTWR